MSSPRSPDSESQSLIAFNDDGQREHYVSFAVGAGFHIPWDVLPEEEAPGSQEASGVFLTGGGLPAPVSPTSPSSEKGDEGGTHRSIEEERASHPDWNELFQTATEARDEGRIHNATTAFEREVIATVKLLIASKSGDADASSLRQLHPYPGRYLHRGVYYLDCSAASDLRRFFGSIDAVQKAASAEVRMLKAMWQRWEKGRAYVPLATLVSLLGHRFFAVAMAPITRDTACGGPTGPGHIRSITHVCASAVQRLSDQLHLPSIYVSDDHHTRLDCFPVLCSLDMVTHFGKDKRPYVFEVARTMPPTDPHVTNALLGYASIPSRPTSRSKSRQLTTTGRTTQMTTLLQPAPNRLSNWARRSTAFRLMRPEALTFFAANRVPIRDSKGATVPTLINNSFDGISSAAFTPFASGQSNELCKLATQHLIRLVAQDLLLMCAEDSDASITPANVAQRLHERGVNYRSLGDVFRAVADLADRSTHGITRDNASDSRASLRTTSGPIPPALPPLSVRPNSQHAAPPAPTPATARGPSRPLPKSSTSGAKTARGKPETPATPALPPLSSRRLACVLTCLKVEGIARCFRAIVEDHWRTSLAPIHEDKRDEFERLADASVMGAAEKSFRRMRRTNTKASELLGELKLLTDHVKLGGDADDEGSLAFQSESVRSIQVAEGSLSTQSHKYCLDGGQRLSYAATRAHADVDRRVRDITARLFTLLSVPGAASEKFWDVLLTAEVWTKYNRLGKRDELRAVPRGMLLDRAAQLTKVRFAVDDVLAAAELAGEIQLHHIKSVGLSLKRMTSSAEDAYATIDYRLCTAVPAVQAMARSALENHVTKLREGPPTSELIQSLAELEARLGLSGEDEKSQLQLVRLKRRHVEARIREQQIREVWEANGLDGVVYIPCTRCPLLINSSIREQHRCPRDSLQGVGEPLRPVVERLPVPLGLADGNVLDRAITASSHRPLCEPRFARLNCNVTHAWEPTENDKYTAWLQVDLDYERTVCAVATQGTPSGAFCRSYRLSYSSDGQTWRSFIGTYSHENRALKCEPQKHDASAKRTREDGSFVPVSSGDVIVRLPVGGMFGNTDGKTVTVNTFDEPIRAKFVRILPGADGDFGNLGLRLELYAIDDHSPLPALHTPGTERIPLRLMSLTSTMKMPQQGHDGLHEAASATREQLAQSELALLREINSLEDAVFDPKGWSKPGRAAVLRHSTDLPKLYERWIALLEQWGPERAGDVTVATSRLATYLIGEAELTIQRSGPRPPPSLVNQVAPLIFASSKQSDAIEPLLRRLRALFRDRPTTVAPLFKRVARWAGRTNRLQPYVATELASMVDANQFLDLARDLLDEGLASEREPTQEDGPPLLDDDAPRRAALLVYTHRKFRVIVEASQRIAIAGKFTYAEV